MSTLLNKWTLFLQTMSCSDETVSLVSCYCQPVISSTELRCTVMEGQKDSAWTKSPVKPPRNRFACPVTTLIKLLSAKFQCINCMFFLYHNWSYWYAKEKSTYKIQIHILANALTIALQPVEVWAFLFRCKIPINPKYLYAISIPWHSYLKGAWGSGSARMYL